MKKRFFRGKSIAQSSIETIIILATALFILTALTAIIYDQITVYKIEQEQKIASVAVNTIAKEVNDTYFLGPGTIKTILVRMPDNIDFNKSSIEGRTLVLNVGGSDIFASVKVDVRGIWPDESGTYSFTISAYDDYVSVSVRPVDVTPNQVTQYLLQGESFDFDLVLNNGSDEDKYYSLILDFPSLSSSEASLTSTHEGLVEVFYGETQSINFTVSCSANSFGSYYGKIIFVPTNSSDANITVPVNLFCSSLQTKLKVYPSTKYFYATTNSVTSDSVLACNTTSRDFTSTSTSVSGAIAPYVVTSFSNTISANSCVSVPFTINAPSSASNYTGSLVLKSGGFTSGVDLNLETYVPESAITISWNTAYFGADGKSINDINLTTLTGPFVITNATVLFLNDIDDANVIGLYLSNQNKLPLNSKLISGQWSTVSDFNLGRRKSYDLNITFDANIRNDSEKFRIILKGSDGTYYWSPIFDPTNSIVDNNISHFSNLIQGQEPIYPQDGNLVGLWRMNDKNSSGWVLNTKTNSYDASLNLGADINYAGLWDKNSVKFDGSNDYVLLQNLSVNTTAGAKNTVSFWMKWDGVNEKMPFSWNSGYDLWFSGGCFGFNTYQGNVFGIPSNGLENNWVHVAAIFYNGVPDAVNNSIYINGVKKDINACKATTTASKTVNSIARIGGGFDGYYFGGYIDDFSIWNHALTEEEVREIYSIGSGIHDFNTQADGNGLYLSTIGGNFVSDGNFYSRVFDFNGKVDFSQLFFTKNTIGSASFNFGLKDNNLNNNYYSSANTLKRIDNNAFVATGERDWNVLNQGSELVSSNYLYDVNLVSLWHLNDNNSDGWVLNSVSNVRDGNLQSGALLNTTGLWSTNSIYLDGTDDYLAIPDSSSSYVGAGGKFTISAWVYPTSVSGLKAVFVSGLSGMCFNYGLVLNGGRLYFRNTNADYLMGGPTLETYKWTHLLLTSDGSTVSGYVNGAFTGTVNYSASSCVGQAVIGVRAFNSVTEMFAGNIEEVAIWNKTFSAIDANNLYKSQKGSWADTNLVGYWKFNDITSQGLIFNSSQNFRDGKIKGTANTTGVGDTNNINFTGGTGTFSSPINLGTTFSVAFTIDANVSASQYILSSSSSQGIFIDKATNADLYVSMGVNGWFRSPSTTLDYWNSRHRVVITKLASDSFGKIYVDGVLVTNTNGNSCANTSLSLATIYPNGNGAIDELVLFNDVKDQAWVTADYDFGDIKRYTSSEPGIINGWHFDEGTGTSSADFVSTNSVALSGSYSWVSPTIYYSGELGIWDSNAGYFDGVNDLVKTTGNSLSASSPFTFSMWIKPNFSNYQQPLIHWGTTSNPRLYLRFESATRLYMDTGSGATSSTKMYWNGNLVCSSYDCSGSTPTFQNNTWYNLVVTGNYTGTAMTNVPILIGAGTPTHAGRYFKGLMDEVKIYNRILSASEIALDYNRVLSSKFVDNNIVDVSSKMNWNSIKVNSDLNYSFGKELSSTQKFGNGLVGLWHLNEVSGTNFSDSSGNGNTASCSSCPSVSSGLWDSNAKNFAGNSCINKTSASTFNRTNGQAMSVSVWVKPNWTSGYREIVANRSNSLYNWMLYIHTTGGKISFHGANQNMSTYTLTNNIWSHVVATVDTSRNLYLYVNGQKVYSLANYTYQSQSPSELHFGCYGSTQEPYVGQMDEVAIWNRALTESEVSDLYRIGATRLDLNIYSCSDANCNTKTSSKYLENVQNNSSIDFNLSLSSSRYLGFDAYFKKAKGLEDLNANFFYISSFIKDINFSYSPGVMDLFARTSTNGYSWSNWSALSQSSPQNLSLVDSNFFQYKSVLSTSVGTVSPVLRDVNVTYSRISN